jgi:hypothetical protein
MRRLIEIMAALLVVLAAAPSQAAESAYTTHDYANCRLIKDEDPYQVRRCTGLGGIAVNWHNEDDDATIDFGTNGSSEQWPYEQSFVFAGNTIEWRGTKTAGTLLPYAAIVRYDLGRSISGPFEPVLMIFRLEGTTGSCLAASVNARHADANVRARRIADHFVRTFQCGKDTRRARE